MSAVQEESGMVKFDISKEDARIVAKIIDRADRLGLIRPSDDTLSINMDLVATHANGCPMDFARMLEADDFNFTHDYCGISRHIDRETGELTGFFLPRFAKRN